MRWVDIPDGQTDHRSWSSDGRWLVVAGSSRGVADDADVELLFENVAERPQLRLVLDRAEQAVISPDGATLALTTAGDVRVLRIPAGDVLLGTRGTEAHFWPEARRLIVDMPGPSGSERHAVFDLRTGAKLAGFAGPYRFRGGTLVAMGGRQATEDLRAAALGPVIIPPDPVDVVAFRPDGARLAACQRDDAKVTLLDASSATVVAAGQLPFGCGGALAWTPDGSALAVARGAAQVALLDGDTGRVLFVQNGDEDEGTDHIAFTPDGRWLCAAFAFRRECPWRVQGRSLLPAPAPPALLGEDTAILLPMDPSARHARGDPRLDGDGPIIALSHDAHVVAEVEDRVTRGGGAVTQLALYDAATRRPLRSVPLLPARDEPDLRATARLRFSEDDRRVHVELSGGARVVEVASGRVVADAPGGELWGDPRSLLGPRDLLDLASGTRRALAPEPIGIAHLSGDGRVITREADGLRVQDWRHGGGFALRGDVTASALSQDGRWLGLRRGSELVVYDLQLQRVVFSRADADAGPLAVSAGQVATVGVDEVTRRGTVRLERWPRGGAITTLETRAFASSIRALAFDPSGATLVASEGNAGCEAWDVATRARLWAHRRFAVEVAASFTRDRVLLGPWVVAARTGRPLARLDEVEPDRVRATALRTDGRLAAIALDGAVRVHDVASGHALASISTRASQVSFDATTGQLLTGGGLLRVWEPSTGHAVLALALSDNGGVVFGAAGDVELVGPEPGPSRRSLVCLVGPVAVPFAACEGWLRPAINRQGDLGVVRGVEPAPGGR